MRNKHVGSRAIVLENHAASIPKPSAIPLISAVPNLRIAANHSTAHGPNSAGTCGNKFGPCNGVRATTRGSSSGNSCPIYSPSLRSGMPEVNSPPIPNQPRHADPANGIAHLAFTSSGSAKNSRDNLSSRARNDGFTE